MYFNALIEAGRKNEARYELSKYNSINHISDTISGSPEYYNNRNKYDQALKCSFQIVHSPSSRLCFISDSYLTQGKISLKHGKFEEAEQLFHKAIDVDPTPGETDCTARSWLGELENKRGNFSKADSLFLDALKYPLNLPCGRNIAHTMYGDFLLQQNRDSEAVLHYNQSITLISTIYLPYYGLAKYHAKRGDQKSALDYLEKALDRYYPIPDPILNEPVFKKIRKIKRFKELMKTHFREEREN